MRMESVGQPCHNFQILGIASIMDPQDGREKVALANFAAGATGTIIILDPESGAGESIDMPGDSGAWALLNYRDERLLVGTCGHFGYLHDLDLRTREWAAPLRDPHETYIWNLELGPDGMVYGGTYPNCVLLRYDPEKRELDNLGRVSDNPGNLYSRMVYCGAPGHVIVVCNSAEPHLAAWSMETGQVCRFGDTGAQVREVNPQFICTQSGDGLRFYDSRTLTPLSEDLSDQVAPVDRVDRYPGSGFSVRLQDGRALAVRGQGYYIDDGSANPPDLLPIPAPAPATHMLTIVADAHGRIWGSSGFGQTIFSWDPDSGETWNSQVVTDNSGEVYGVAVADGRLFLACYSGGDHVVYDPAQPWSQLDNQNPRTLAPVGPELIRPAGKSVVGPDGNVWTGWMAQYGVYGGGISRVDATTLEMTSWLDPVPGQAIMALAADERYLYFVTGGNANGLQTRVAPFHFVVWSPDGHIVWQRQFAEGSTLAHVVAGCGHVVIAVDDRLEIFDPDRLEFAGSVDLKAPCHYLACLWPDCVAAFGETEIWWLDPVSQTAELTGHAPGRVGTATVTPAGTAYCAIGNELFRLEP